MPGFGKQARADRVCAAVSAICDIGPRDTLEGMLAAQMIAPAACLASSSV